MKIVFAGKLEAALIRSVDELITPSRNARPNGYYGGLNRLVDKGIIERAQTFLALSETTLVPQVDWNYPIEFPKFAGDLAKIDLGVRSTEAGGREWDDDTINFVKTILSSRFLSDETFDHIARLKTHHMSPQDRRTYRSNEAEILDEMANHYLNRLLLQVRAAREADCFLVMLEEDIRVLSEITSFLSEMGVPSPYDLPDLRPNLIDPDQFLLGFLNFGSHELRSVAAVRSDRDVRKYASKIDELLRSQSVDADFKLVEAMTEAHGKSQAVKKVDKVFEVASWVVKPLHYIPVVGEIVGAAEDVKDLAVKWADKKRSNQEWFLLGVKMKDIAINDFLRRKGNQFG